MNLDARTAPAGRVRSEGELERGAALLIDTHSRIDVDLAQGNRPTSAFARDVYDAILHVRERDGLNLCSVAHHQGELPDVG